MKHLSQVNQGHNIRCGIVGSSLKVVVNNGKTYKNREVIISIAKIDGVVSIRHNVYNTLKGLAPAWVLPKSPNPTHNNGILMVVKGNHCGKYVRRIHHRSMRTMATSRRSFYWQLSIRWKAADTLTGEQFELGPDSLCIAVETNKDRKLNANLMNSLRENAHKHR